MILQRVTAGLKKHDWGTVVLEVLIVVVGIFAALQVDDWNQRRKDRVLEQQYLERLHTDAITAVERQREARNWNQTRVRTQEIVIGAIRSGALGDDQRAGFSVGLAHAGSHNPLIWHWGTVEELYSTGNILLINDTGLRNLISATEGGYMRRLEIINAAKAQIHISRGQISRHFDPIEYGYSSDSPATVHFDFEALSSDKEFIATFSNLHLNSKRVVLFSEAHLVALEEFEAGVARARDVEPMAAVKDSEQ